MAFVDNFQDFIKYHADAAGMTREEFMAVLMSEDKKKPGPDTYHRGLNDDEVEDKEDQIKKQAKMDDDDPDAYEEMPGDKEAREKGEVKTSKATKAYNKLYKENKHVKSINEMAMGYDARTGLFYIKGVPFTEERLEQVLNHLTTKVKLGDLPKQFSYFPAIQVADNAGGEIVTITLDKAKEIRATLKRFKGKLAHDGDFNEAVNPIHEAKESAWDKLNRIADEEYGEFGFSTLGEDDMADHIDMEKADKLADKEYGEFGFTSLDEDDMEELINNNPKLVKESIVTEKDDKDQKSTDRGPLDDDKIETALKTKAEESGVPIGIIRAVMRRGLAAWKSGHRPGANQQQWGYARVNAFLTKGEGTWGNADKDLAKEVRDGGHDKKLKKA